MFLEISSPWILSTDFAHHMRAPCVGGASYVSSGGRRNTGLGIKSPGPACTISCVTLSTALHIPGLSGGCKASAFAAWSWEWLPTPAATKTKYSRLASQELRGNDSAGSDRSLGKLIWEVKMTSSQWRGIFVMFWKLLAFMMGCFPIHCVTWLIIQ